MDGEMEGWVDVVQIEKFSDSEDVTRSRADEADNGHDTRCSNTSHECCCPYPWL
jgi:hypothetical protein